MTPVFLEIDVSQFREESKRFAKLESRCFDMTLAQGWKVDEWNQKGRTSKQNVDFKRWFQRFVLAKSKWFPGLLETGHHVELAARFRILSIGSRRKSWA